MATENSLTDLLEKLNDFSKMLEEMLEELDILDGVKNLNADHACIRLEDSNAVDSLKGELLALGKVISAVHVHGREIAILQLDKPLKISNWIVPALEIPHPKPNRPYKEGWHHVEFVFSDTESSMEKLREKLFDTFPHLDIEILKRDYQYYEEIPSVDDDQMPNPTIEIVGSNGVSIKFHTHTIQEVVGHTE